jgi:ATP adenylyltransferase
MAYVSGPKPPGCIFCLASDTLKQQEHLVLAQHPVVVMLNKFPYANAHVMVAPRRHVAQLDALSTEDFQLLMKTLRDTTTLIDQALHPGGFNIGINLGAAAGAGIADHLHWHVVPRWIGDTNFMPTLADVRVISEHLDATYDRLRPLFEKGAGC